MVKTTNFPASNGPEAAHVICSASDGQLAKMFHHLLVTRELSNTVHALNEMLADPECYHDAHNALHRLGLDLGA
jgi:predicted metal-binding protein